MRRVLFPAVVGTAAVLPLISGEYASLIGSLAVIYGLVALGYVVLAGWTGDVSLGQIVPYGLGAYATFWLSHTLGLPVGLALLLAPLVTIPFIAMIGFPALRLRGLDLAIGTFTIALVGQLMLFRSMGEWLSGGKINPAFARQAVPVERPSLGPISLESNRSFYVACLVLGLVGYAAVAVLGRSPSGRVLRAIRDDPLRARVLGVPVGRYRLAAFVFAGMLAALGGALLACLREGVTPPTFSVFESLNLLTFAIIGGLATPRGAVIGGICGAVMPEISRFDPFRFLQGRLLLAYGAILVVLLVFRPGGVAGLLGLDRNEPLDLPEPDEDEPGPTVTLPADDGTPVLAIESLSVSFGAFRALEDVTFSVAPGEAVALIGPNGAGKSTFIDTVTGLVEPGAGTIRFQRDDITKVAPERRASLGLGRTFQTARLFSELSVAANLVAAAHHHVAEHGESRLVAARLLRDFALDDVADHLPTNLSFGSLRMLEVALALAPGPRLLLLDEPTAGMDPADIDRLCRLLDELRKRTGLALLVVEHDMGVVRRLAERVVVLDQGRVIATGTPAQIANDPAVVASYLGTSADRLANEKEIVAHA